MAAREKQMSDGDRRASFQSVARSSPTQQVREQLLAAIEAGEYKPGDALPSERSLCALFDVSRVSVREAIAGLIAMGVVKSQQGRGCFVLERSARRTSPFLPWLALHRDELVELLEVRAALDELAAYKAAELCEAQTARALREAHQAFAEVAGQAELDADELIHRDVIFHRSVAQASGSELLVALLDELADRIADSRRVTLVGRKPRDSAREHGRIVRAIVKRDPKASREAAGAHVRSVREWVEANGSVPR